MNKLHPKWSWIDTAGSLFCGICLAAVIAAVVITRNCEATKPIIQQKRVPVYVPMDWCRPVPIMPPQRGPTVYPTLISAELLQASAA